jgi:beta-phosphoglucomutase
MPRLSGLLFDLDGVVVDNMGFHAQAWRRFFLLRGIRLREREFHEKTAGMPTRDVLAYYLRRRLAKAEAERLTQEKEALYQKLYKPLLKPLGGLRRFLSSARRLGLRLGVGTGAREENATFVLDGLDLRGAFDAVVTAGDVRRGKPHPDTFLALARRLGLSPGECLVFEDSLLGEEAARRAGMRVVAVTTSQPARAFRHAEEAVRDFSGWSPADLPGIMRERV